GIHEAANPRVARGHQHVQGAGRVDRVSLDGFVDRERDPGERRRVKHAVNPRECWAYRLEVADVGLDELRARVEILAFAGQKGVDDSDGDAASDEFIDKV